MNEEEKFLFDLQGYIILEGLLDSETVARMNAYIDAKAKEDPNWRAQKGNSHAENPITWGPEFLNLMDHPRILPILKELMGDYLRLDHDYAIFLEPGHTGLELHGPTMYPYDPIHYFKYVDGKMYNGLCVATFALTDVLAGGGGLALIPGSHKCNYRVPLEIRKYRQPSPVVKQIPTKAGDCVIFTEALIHGTLPWTGPGERRTLFYKYTPNGIAWEKRTYFPHDGNPAMQKLEAELTERQRLMLSPASAKDYLKPIV